MADDLVDTSQMMTLEAPTWPSARTTFAIDARRERRSALGRSGSNDGELEGFDEWISSARLVRPLMIRCVGVSGDR